MILEGCGRKLMHPEDDFDLLKVFPLSFPASRVPRRLKLRSN